MNDHRIRTHITSRFQQSETGSNARDHQSYPVSPFYLQPVWAVIPKPVNIKLGGKKVR